MAFVIAAVVFIAAYGLGNNGGFGGSSSTVSSNESAVVSNNARDLDTAAISAKVSPGVVNINTTVAGGGSAAGTGMVLTPDGEVLTNSHVIGGATDIRVEIGGSGTTRPAKVLGYSITEDVALIKVRNVSNLTTVTLGDSTRVTVNDRVVAIGNALGRGGNPAISPGVVAALNQTITAGDGGGNAEILRNMIQIQAEIQPGDSGGPLVNTAGEVIGMNTAAASRYFRQSSANVAFAIPINDARAIAEQISQGKESASIHIGERGIIGVSIRSAAGAVVWAVEEGSPAEEAGIQPEDTITGVNSTTIRSAAELNAAMSPFQPGDRVTISWTDSAGEERSETVTLVLGPPG